MTTFEVSNLGRYGYMGGRGGQSLRDQSGAMKQAAVIGAGIGPSASIEESIGGDAAAFGVPGPDGTAQVPDAGNPPPPPHMRPAHAHHQHGPARCCQSMMAPLLRILGLDLFTKGKAINGMARAGAGQNPFDMGLVRVSLICFDAPVLQKADSPQNCQDFWGHPEEVDYTSLYEIPPEGWTSYRRQLRMFQSGKGDSKGYEPIPRQEV